MQPINVVVAADGAFCRQLAVTISGISRFAGGVAHRVFVFHDGYEAELRRRVERSATDGVDIKWVEATSAVLDTAILPEYLPKAALYRLRITELLPDDVERVIFLDTDVVVRGPLVELSQTDLDGALLGAVRDAVYPWAGSPQCLDWRALGVPPDTPYFNSGVMLIPLEHWRSTGVGPRALELLGAHVFRYGDQCALNAVASGDWKALPPHWNLQSGHLPQDSPAWIVEPSDDMERALSRPTVVHFTWFLGQRKPWEARSTAPHRDLWFDALDHTAWTGWRPDDAPPSRIRLLAARARRAGGVLLHGS
jgi:lipopolysaccharide biosynthesis glycosyltransferase